MKKELQKTGLLQKLIFAIIFLFAFNISNAQTSIVVTSLADNTNAGTLRWAIGQANATAGGIYDAITFNVTGTIVLTSHLPTITQSVTITGPGQNNLTIDGNNLYRVIYNTSSIAISISDMTLTKGYTGTIDQGGGLIWNQNGTLTITNVKFTTMTLNVTQSAAFCQKQAGVTTFNNCIFNNLNAGINANHGSTPNPTSSNDADYQNRVYVNNCTFSNNVYGIQTERFTKIDNCTFLNNTVCAASLQGLNRQTVINSIFSNNVKGIRTSCGMPTTWTLTSLNQLIEYNTFEANSIAVELANTWTATMSTSPNYIATVRNNCFVGNTTTINGVAGYTESNNLTTIISSITGSSTVCLSNKLFLSNSTIGGTWSSSNTAIATVDSLGVVSPISAGSVIIYYTINSGACSGAVTKNVSVITPTFNTPFNSGDYIWFGSSSTDWATLSNWRIYDGINFNLATQFPANTDSITIPLTGFCVTNQPTLTSGNIALSKIIIEPGAYLTLGSATLSLTGDFINNGYFIPGTGTLEFNGSSIQNLYGKTNFYNLTLNNSSGLVLNSPVKVINNLTLIAGTINASNPSVWMSHDGASLNGWTVSGAGGVGAKIDPSIGNLGSSYKIGGTGLNNMSMKMDLGDNFKNKIIQFDYRPTGTTGFAGVTIGALSTGSSGLGLNLGVGTQTTLGFNSTQNFLYQNASNNTYTFVAGTWYTIKIVTDNGTVGGTKWYVNDVLVGNSGSFAIGNGTYIGFVNNNMSTSSTAVNFDNISITSTSGQLSLGESSASPGSLTYTSGTITGKLKRYFSASATTTTGGLFPVGTAAYNRSAKVNFTSSPGTNQFLTVEYKTGAPLDASNAPLYAGLPTTIAGQLVQVYSADGYWQIDPTDNNYASTICTTPYNLTLNANNLTNFNNPSTVRIIKAAGSNTLANHHVSWQGAGTHTPNTTTNATVAEISSTNCTGFSWFNIGTWNDQALPVELTSFSSECKESGVDINWQTASEYNSELFTLEKSRDGENWQQLSTQTAAGTSTSLQNYSYTDNEKNGLSYYRLQQIDQDGNQKMYGPISANCEFGGLSVLTYPNPSSDYVNVMIESDKAIDKATIVLKDQLGHLVYEATRTIERGTTQLVLNDVQLAPGVYTFALAENQLELHVSKHIVR